MCAAERADVHGGQCVDEQGQSVPCCAWQADSWVPSYMSLASVTMLWTVFLFGQFRIFTISGTIAQWCESPLCSPPLSPQPALLGPGPPVCIPQLPLQG